MIAPDEKLIEQFKSVFGVGAIADASTVGFDFYAEAVKQNEPTPKESAEAGIRNAMSFTELAIKSGAIIGHNLELIDQANAIMQAVLDNLDSQPVPVEVSHRLANVVNELCACEKLCGGEIKTAVYDLSVATERLCDRIA